MLLDKDGLAKNWDKGVRTYYEEKDDCLETPFAIRKLLDINLATRYDTSGNGKGNDYIDMDNDTGSVVAIDEECVTQQNTDQTYNVNDLPLDEFRNRLIRHFNIAFKKNEIVWPRRN